MEQNRRPRSKTAQLQLTDLTKEFKAYIGKKTTPSTNGTGKTGYLQADY
jgi:hypothetical protein